MVTTSGSDSASVTSATGMPKLPVTADTRGRVRTSKAQRRVILSRFESSGLSAAQFARQTGLKYCSGCWVQRYRRTKRPERRSPLRLLEAVVTPAPSKSALLVELPGGARLEISEAGQVPLVATLLRALEQPC